MMESNVAQIIIKNFLPERKILSFEKYGEGHINETYLFVLDDNQKYILQGINNTVFPNIDGLMNNIELVTEYLKKKIKAKGGDVRRETLNLIKTTENKNYFKYNGKYYRLYYYISDTYCCQIVKSTDDFYNAAKTFGNFYKLLDGFDASKLVEIIPNFHNTKKRYADFLKAVNEDKLDRAKNCQKEIQFIKDRERYYSILVDLLANNEIPLKVTHNDTKLNNILFDRVSGKPLVVIDLDTVMPGTILYDFGDSIRFGCNPCLEDEKDLTKVNFQFNLYKAFVKGFIESLGDSLTQKEKEHLAISSIILTIECGMRFLGDYLSGDTYFHTNREGQNLDRARTQLKLVADMEAIIDQMNELVK